MPVLWEALLLPLRGRFGHNSPQEGGDSWEVHRVNVGIRIKEIQAFLEIEERVQKRFKTYNTTAQVAAFLQKDSLITREILQTLLGELQTTESL